MTSTKTTCEHPSESVISTAAGKFCMLCGTMLTQKVMNKIIIRSDIVPRTKSVSDIKPVRKSALSPAIVKTADISSHRLKRSDDKPA